MVTTPIGCGVMLCTLSGPATTGREGVDSLRIWIPASSRGARFGEANASKPSAWAFVLRLPRYKRLLKNRVTSLTGWLAAIYSAFSRLRSEERRVGKEC